MHRSNNRDLPVWAVLTAIVVLGLPACYGLLQSKVINGHDAFANLIMALYMDKYAGDGQFLIRWASYFNYGYGYPMFNFYPPAYFILTFFLSAIIHNVVLSMNLTAAFFWVLSGVGMYFWSREFWGDKGGLLSAVAYIYVPYHVQDIYIRSAFSEFSSFAFFPLLLLSFYKISQDISWGYVLLGVISVFVLSCMHPLMLMIFMPIAIFYLLFLCFLNKNLQGFWAGLFILGTGLLTSAFYWLPAFVEKQYLNISLLTSLTNDFHNNFITWRQLLHFPWETNDFNGISFQIGMAQLVLAFFPLVFVPNIFKENRRAVLHYFFFLGVVAAAVYFVLPASCIFWEHFSLLKFVQLPWRFLAIASFALSMLAGSLMILFKGRTANIVLLAALGLIVCSSMKFFWPVHFFDIDQKVIKDNLLNVHYLGEGISTPKWIKYRPAGFPNHKFEFIHGVGETAGGELIQDRTISAIEHVAQIHMERTGLVCFHSYYFPGWKVFIDGKETPIDPNNRYGVILFTVLPGDHTVRVVFGPTPIRSAGMMISWLGVILLLGGILWIKITK